MVILKEIPSQYTQSYYYLENCILNNGYLSKENDQRWYVREYNTHETSTEWRMNKIGTKINLVKLLIGYWWFCWSDNPLRSSNVGIDEILDKKCECIRANGTKVLRICWTGEGYIWLWCYSIDRRSLR